MLVWLRRFLAAWRIHCRSICEKPWLPTPKPSPHGRILPRSLVTNGFAGQSPSKHPKSERNISAESFQNSRKEYAGRAVGWAVLTEKIRS